MARDNRPDDSNDEPDYYGVFNAFAQAMRRDFAGLPAGGAAPQFQPYLEEFAQKAWNGEGYTIQFAAAMETYLRAFRVPSVQLGVDHRCTPYYPDYTWGMHVRACGDALYVTEALPACPFAPGDEIVNASVYAEPTFRSVAALRRRFGASLYGDEPERELWDPILHFVNRYLVAADGGEGEGRPACTAEAAPVGTLPEQLGMRVADSATTRRVKVERLPRASAPVPPAFELGTTTSGTPLLTLRDLSDEGALAAFVAQHRDEFDRAERLVVDVRRCAGGAETAVLPLLPYLVGAPTSPAAFMETRCLTTYSAGNVARQTEEFDAIARTVTDPDVLEAIAGWKAELAEKSGAGVVEEDLPVPEELQTEVAPRGRAARVCLLTDVDTCDAAEFLAEACHAEAATSGAPGRTVVVGRATRGSRGYFNPATFVRDCFSLTYPTSRFTDEGLARHFAFVGVPPQVHVPWTPAFCEAAQAGSPDPDLQSAEEALR